MSWHHEISKLNIHRCMDESVFLVSEERTRYFVLLSVVLLIFPSSVRPLLHWMFSGGHLITQTCSRHPCPMIFVLFVSALTDSGLGDVAFLLSGQVCFGHAYLHAQDD